MKLTTQDIALLLEITQDAGAAIMRFYHSDVGTTFKQDNSPVTEADLAADQVIKVGLLRHWPNVPILSEESADIDVEIRSQWQTFWLVDPLDGTKEFINRNGEFTVNIALIHNGIPVFGVVYAPAKDLLYWGGEAYGAFKRDVKAQQTILAEVLDTENPPVVVVSRSHPSERLQGYCEQMGAYEYLPTGSSLKLCMVAEGSASVYPRLGPTSQWDIAAAHAVLFGAQGRLTLALHPEQTLSYKQKQDFINPYFIASVKNFLPPIYKESKQ